MKRSKNYNESLKLIDKTKIYDAKEAMDLVVSTSKAKFDETVELHVKLGVDGRNADQQVRGVVVLPEGTGKTVKVLVFAKGDKVAEAEAAGVLESRHADPGPAGAAALSDLRLHQPLRRAPVKAPGPGL